MMELAISLCAGFAFALAFRTPLVRWPVLGYLGTAALDVAFLAGFLSSVAPDAARALLPYLRRCIAPYGLFAVVMFVGVLPEGSRVWRYLSPARGGLSVVAALLALCHIVSYLSTYLDVILSGFATASSTTAVSLMLAVVLLALLALLTVTSFRLVKFRMSARMWTRVQRLSYAFFGLMGLHAIFVLLPSCALGGKPATSVGMCGLVLVAYAVLRVRRWRADASGVAALPARVT